MPGEDKHSADPDQHAARYQGGASGRRDGASGVSDLGVGAEEPVLVQRDRDAAEVGPAAAGAAGRGMGQDDAEHCGGVDGGAGYAGAGAEDVSSDVEEEAGSG